MLFLFTAHTTMDCILDYLQWAYQSIWYPTRSSTRQHTSAVAPVKPVHETCETIWLFRRCGDMMSLRDASRVQHSHRIVPHDNELDHEVAGLHDSIEPWPA